MNNFRTMIAIGSGLGVLGFISCGKDDGGSGELADTINTPPINKDDEGYCGLVSAEEVSTTLDISDLLPPEATVVTSQTTCQYVINGKFSRVTLSYNTGTYPEDFDAERKCVDSVYAKTVTRDVTGVGEAAYSFSLAEGTSIETNSLYSVSIEKGEQLAALIISKL